MAIRGDEEAIGVLVVVAAAAAAAAVIIIVTRPPLESYLNWIADPAPIPPRKDNQENLPPSAEPRKLPRKMRPRSQKKHHHHHHLGATRSAPGISQPSRCVEYPSEASPASRTPAASTASRPSSQS